MQQPTILVILDGFGYNPETYNNAIAQAHKPNLDYWFSCYPHTLLKTSGTAVGLPPGYIGNSEVGHLTIGCGRVVPQAITVINNAITDGSFFHNPVLVKSLQEIKKRGTTLHIMGLLSDAGVHSHEQHLFAFLQAAAQQKIDSVIVHPFLDGRDVPQKSAAIYLQWLDNVMQSLGTGTIGSLHGRYYAMDRDQNWDRTQRSYETLMTVNQKPHFDSWHAVLDYCYAHNITDEFIPPTQLTQYKSINPGDGIIFFNFRPDRARQLTACFVNPSLVEFSIAELPIAWFITPYPYADNLKTTDLFHKAIINNTLSQVLAKAHKRIFAIAETEKYAHVSYFFDGGKEKPEPHETRIIIPSIKAETYAPHPCMSAPEITKTVIESLKTDPHDFYLINYANADMVGHSGDMAATIKAVECLDKELKKLYDVIVKEMNGTLYITADHGKAEIMIDPQTGNPRTAHTISDVPFIMLQRGLGNSPMKLPLHELADIAPFILRNMGLPIPPEMHQLS